jgi:uncharacterized membrane protein YqjE
MPVAMPSPKRRNATPFGSNAAVNSGHVASLPGHLRRRTRSASEEGRGARGAPSAAHPHCPGAAQIGTAHASLLDVAIPNRPPSNTSLDSLPTTELMRQVLDETKELVRIETRLAREEIQADLIQLKGVAVFGGVAALLALLTLSTLVVALVLALGGGALVALVASAALLLGASVAGGIAYQKLPKPPLARTRERLKTDMMQLKEHIQ